MTTNDVAKLCRVLASASRLELLRLIIRGHGELCVAELEDRLSEAGIDLEQATISYHIKKLHNAGLIEHVTTRGLHEYYAARPETLSQLGQAIMDYVESGVMV